MPPSAAASPVAPMVRSPSIRSVGSAGIRIKGKPAADIFIMDPDELTRALLVDEAIIDDFWQKMRRQVLLKEPL